jgi:hypothetical protein
VTEHGVDGLGGLPLALPAPCRFEGRIGTEAVPRRCFFVGWLVPAWSDWSAPAPQARASRAVAAAVASAAASAVTPSPSLPLAAPSSLGREVPVRRVAAETCGGVKKLGAAI